MVLVLWADRRFRLGHGQAFALYVAAYCTGRLWIESLRVDTAERVLGLRLNIFTSVIVFTLAVGYLIWSRRRHGEREASPYRQVPAQDETARVAREPQAGAPSTVRPPESTTGDL